MYIYLSRQSGFYSQLLRESTDTKYTLKKQQTNATSNQDVGKKTTTHFVHTQRDPRGFLAIPHLVGVVSVRLAGDNTTWGRVEQHSGDGRGMVEGWEWSCAAAGVFAAVLQVYSCHMCIRARVCGCVCVVYICMDTHIWFSECMHPHMYNVRLSSWVLSFPKCIYSLTTATKQNDELPFPTDTLQTDYPYQATLDQLCGDVMTECYGRKEQLILRSGEAGVHAITVSFKGNVRWRNKSGYQTADTSVVIDTTAW